MRARVPLIRVREQLAEEFHSAFDAIAASRGSIAGPFAVLLHSPVIADLTARLGAYIRFESSLSDADRELAIIAAARQMECEYEWTYHAPLARKAGVREEAIAGLRDNAPLTAFTELEAEVVDYVRKLLGRHRIEQPLFDALAARFGIKGLVELTATAAYYTMLACTLNAFEVLPE